jgi:hypothetical protein
MSDSAEVVVAIDCAPADALARRHKVLDWLIAEAIAVPEPSGCVLSSHLGYAPGDRFHVAIAEPNWQPEQLARVLQLRTDRIDPVVDRTVHDSGDNGVQLTRPAVG